MRFKTDTEAVILAVLANGPKHGYGIAKTIRTESGGVLKLGEGQLYPMLRAMEEAGWVLGEWDPAAGDQPRRIYSISEKGQAELERRAESWQAFVHAVDRFIPAPPLKSQADGPKPFATPWVRSRCEPVGQARTGSLRACSPLRALREIRILPITAVRQPEVTR